MHDYFDGVVPQLVARAEHLLASIPHGLSFEFHLLEQTCRQRLTEVTDGLRALIQESLVRQPKYRQVRIRQYRRLIEDLDLLETVAIPALARAQDSDRFLNRLVQQIRSEIRYPLLPPVVSPFSQSYFRIYGQFHLICVPLGEGHFLLHLPDIYHELAHPLVWQSSYPAIKPYQTALLETLDLLANWLQDELQREERGRGPVSYQFYIKQWIRSWEDWCIELFCDLFATFTLGPAFAWSHLHLCAARGANPFEIPLISVTTHPADDARMRAILNGLCLIGFDNDATLIEGRWRELIKDLGVAPDPEYQRCFPRQILNLLADNTLRGVRAMGCRIASPVTADPVHAVLNQAWHDFWRSPAQYSARERTLMETLRKSPALAFA